jgi:ribosomal protein S18 acetylase RimI-like enzyme
MKIRKATSKDLDAIVELSDLMLKFHSDFDPYYSIYSKYEDHKQYYSDQLKKKDALYVVAENDKKEIVGFASAYMVSMPKTKAPKIGTLVTNFVKKEYRGKGFGTAMFNFRMDWLKKNKVKHVEMRVDAHNKKALRLWRKYGFKDYQIGLKIDL